MSYWRSAGLTYLQYINVATTFARKVTKEAVRAKYMSREGIHYRKQKWAKGLPVGEKQNISSLAERAQPA